MALVVVAEDNVEHQRAIGRVVRGLGHEAVIASDGRAGLAAVTAHRPDLVIADVDMPQLDGLAMCEAIRQEPGFAGVPIVVVSGYLLPGDPRVAEAGGTAVLRKPFSIAELTDCLRDQLGEPGPGVATGPPPGEGGRVAAARQVWQLVAESTSFFDELVQMTAGTVQAPMAAAMLVTEAGRQLLLGCYGLDPDPAAQRLVPVQFSPCLRVTATGEHLAVADVRTADGLDLGSGVHDDRIAAYLGAPVHDPAGTVIGAVAVVDSRPRPWTTTEVDLVRRAATLVSGSIADRVRRHTATREAERSRAFLDAVLDSLNTGVAACDTVGRLVLFNQALRDVFGAEGEEIRLPDWPEHFTLRHHDGTPLSAAEMPLMRALAGEHVDHADLLTHDRQERPRWFVINARPIRDATGGVLGAVAATHDITAEYRGRQYQTCKTAVLKVLAAAPDTATAGREVLHAVATTLGWPYAALWLVDAVTAQLRPAATWNAPGWDPVRTPARIPRGVGLAGTCWERAELIWVPDTAAEDSLVNAQTAASAGFRAAGGVPVRSGKQVIGVLTFFSHGREEPDPAMLTLLTSIAGHIGHYLDRRRAEELALHLAASTDEYVSLVGHELRTPLTSISAYTDLIAQSSDVTTVGEIRDLLEVVGRNTAQLRALVDKLLDLAALESGHATLAAATVDLAGIVAAAVAAADADQVTIRTHAPDQLSLVGDGGRLRQLVDNLVSNAVKYSSDGTVIDVTLTGHDDTAVLTVADCGVGIPAAEQDHLFRRFFRASNARHRGIPGAGLGLALSRVVVERHHGTITVAPREPSGTVVTVRLPRAVDAGPAPTDTPV